MSVDTGRESGAVLCRALGLEPREVTAITIRWRDGEMPIAEVEMFLNEHAVYEIIKLRPDEQAVR